MSAVDEKREIFAHAFIANMAGGMSRNKAAIAAAEAAGYRGKIQAARSLVNSVSMPIPQR